MSAELVQMAIDSYKGRTATFSKDEVNNKIREQLIEMNGGKEKLTKKDMRNNPEIFEFLEDTLRVLVVDGITDQFDGFAEVRDVEMGQQQIFDVPSDELFRVSAISEGNNKIRRQRISNGQVHVDTHWRGIKIYEELSRLMAGHIDWADLVSRVSRSYQSQIAKIVYNTIYNSFDQLGATYKVTTNDNDTITDMAQHVEAATGEDVVIYGTKQALAKLDPTEYSDNMLDEKNNTGYLGRFRGFELREIQQAHKNGTDEFAIDNNFLLVVPTPPERMVKIVNEGEALIEERSNMDNADMTSEYGFFMQTGVAIVTANKYGIIKFS